MATGTIVVTVHRPLRDMTLKPEDEARLKALAAHVVSNDGDEPWTQDDLMEHLDPDVRAVITSWGSPTVDLEALAAAPNLEIVAHAAGSVRPYVDESAWDSGVRVTHAADVIAEAVAEYTIGAILLALRGFIGHQETLRAGAWKQSSGGSNVGGLLAERRVGVVAASMVGRRVIPLLRAFTPDVVLYDPFVDEQDAADMGVQLADLDTLMRTSDVVTLHAPILSATHHMIGRRELDLMKPGALFVNCARAWLVDQDALLDVLAAGRIDAVLDVFDEEPLPADSPFRDLPNAILTPHIAGFTLETRARQMGRMVDEISRHFAGEPLRHEISREQVERMA
ncbi:MAG: hydroxyacid dehydrogenase [Chloroflexi bacterium]|nr:hydroxyacid dehydrogenase [Chloroflexota bacterium]